MTTAIGETRVGGSAEPAEHEEADVRADHEDLAVGEVQELQDPVDHRVPDGDQAVEAPERQARDELIEEVVPRQLEVLEVAGQELSGVHSRNLLRRAAHRRRWAARLTSQMRY